MGRVEPLTARATFPLEALPPWARDYVEQTAHVLQVDATVPALTVLGATAIGVQAKAELAVRGGWVEPLAFWTFAALRSGNRKTPALMRPMRPLCEYERAENEARARYRKRLEERAEALPQRARDRKSRERALREAAPPDLELFASDATPEALALGLGAQNESFAVVTDEPTSLAMILQGLYAEGRGANTGILMAGYSGAPYRRKRVKSPDVALRRPALSLVLIGQPRTFEELTSAENLIELGFVGRLLIARPHDRLGERQVHDDAVEPGVEDGYAQNMKALLDAPAREPLPDVRCGWVPEEPEPWPTRPLERHRLHLTPEARELHREHEERIEPLLADGAPLGELSDFGAKLSGLIARAAALLHALHHPEDFYERPVGVEAMGHGIELGRFALGQVLAVFGERAKREAEESLADHVLARARKLSANGAGGVVTWRQLCRALVQGNGRGRIRDRETLSGVVELLEDRGDLTRDHTATKGARWLVRREDGEPVGQRRYGEHEEARA